MNSDIYTIFSLVYEVKTMHKNIFMLQMHWAILLTATSIVLLRIIFHDQITFIFESNVIYKTRHIYFKFNMWDLKTNVMMAVKIKLTTPRYRNVLDEKANGDKREVE